MKKKTKKKTNKQTKNNNNNNKTRGQGLNIKSFKVKNNPK